MKTWLEDELTRLADRVRELETKVAWLEQNATIRDDDHDAYGRNLNPYDLNDVAKMRGRAQR